MTLTWTKEDAPRWDADKQRLFGQVELAAVGLACGLEWGDARITFFVAPGQRGRGVGRFILEHLEGEAAARGLNYIYNVVPPAHPDGPWITNWLQSHGFREASRGQLRRRVETVPAR